MKTNSSTEQRLDAESAEQTEIAELEEAQLSQTTDASLDEEAITSEGEALSEDDRPDAGNPPSSTGSQTPRVPLEDEASAAVEEVEEGIDEADADTRARSGHQF